MGIKTIINFCIKKKRLKTIFLRRKKEKFSENKKTKLKIIEIPFKNYKENTCICIPSKK